MKACIFYARIEQYGGIERNIVALAQVIADKGMTPVLICFQDSINMHRVSGGILEVIVIETNNLLSRVLRIREIVGKRSHDRPGAIVCFGIWGGAFLSLTGLPYVLHYTDPPSVMPSMNSWLRRAKFRVLSTFAVRRAAARVTMTKRNATELSHQFGRKFDVLYQGGVPPTAGFKVARKAGRLTLISVCRLSDSKNLDWAIKLHRACMADEIIKNKFSCIELVLVGEGPERERLEELAKASEAGSFVHFLGFCGEDEVERAMAAASVALIPGVQGYGLPALEALYRGVAVILNQASGVSEIVENSKRVCITSNHQDDFVQTGLRFLRIYDVATATNFSNDLKKPLPTEMSWGNSIGKTALWW